MNPQDEIPEIDALELERIGSMDLDDCMTDCELEEIWKDIESELELKATREITQTTA